MKCVAKRFAGIWLFDVWHNDRLAESKLDFDATGGYIEKDIAPQLLSALTRLQLSDLNLLQPWVASSSCLTGLCRFSSTSLCSAL